MKTVLYTIIKNTHKIHDYTCLMHNAQCHSIKTRHATLSYRCWQPYSQHLILKFQLFNKVIKSCISQTSKMPPTAVTTRTALLENNEASAKLTTENGGMFTSSSARLRSQSRYSMLDQWLMCFKVFGYWAY